MNRSGMDAILAESFKELAVERPIEKITIKDITDRAGVIRPTFYNHFQDKFELMQWIIMTELMKPLRPLLEAGMVDAAMTLLFTNIEKDKAYYTRAVKLEGPVSFHQIALDCIKEVLSDIVANHMSGKTSKHPWLTPDLICSYYAGSMVFAFEEWVKTGMTVSPQEMSEAYHYIITRSMVDALEEL